ncbi:MAG TPA: hypothetical protein VG937_20805 [Polyangiaceae bacterium]|nr:hypothetical protein [Polyangiaceae bacterium]
MMTHRRWVTWVLASTLALSLLAGAANYSADVFGVYRSTKNRELKVYHNGRTTKFLLSFDYIPTNFSGLFIGSSVTENWDTSKIESARVYNASFTGANISEQALVARNVFARRRLRLVIITVFPYQTASHGRKTSYMVSGEYWAGLGSIALLRAYTGLALERLAARPPEHDSQGVSSHSAVFVAPAAGRPSARTIEVVDPLGFADFVALVREAHAHAEQVVAMIPPYARPVWEAQRTFLTRYAKSALAAFQPDDIVVDFNRPEYAAFQNEPTNFADGTHISSEATSFLTKELARLVQSEEGPRVREYLRMQ